MILIGLGTNQGACIDNLQRAVVALSALGKVLKVSSVWQTEPWGFHSEHQFYNQVVLLESELTAEELLHTTQAIERRMGRTQKSDGSYHDRIIDIDILAYDTIEQKTDELQLPHPFMHKRNFVLYPLVEIAPEWIHPTFKKSASCLLQESDDTSIPTVYCS